jgi:hypothetical protein
MRLKAAHDAGAAIKLGRKALALKLAVGVEEEARVRVQRGYASEFYQKATLAASAATVNHHRCAACEPALEGWRWQCRPGPLQPSQKGT